MAYTLNEKTARAALVALEFVPAEDRAMAALASLFGAQALIDLHEDPGSEQHDGAWNCLGVLENHMKVL